MRKIISLGADSRFAVCDDGAVFFWTGQKWEPWGRPPIPQPDCLCRCGDRTEPHLHSNGGTYLPPPVVDAVAEAKIEHLNPTVAMGSGPKPIDPPPDYRTPDKPGGQFFPRDTKPGRRP